MFWRLLIAYVTLLLVAVGLLGSVLTSRVDGYYQEQARASLITQAYLVRAAMREWPPQPSASVQQRLKSMSQEIGARLTLIDPDGRVLGDSDELPERMDNHADRPEVLAARAERLGRSTRFSQTVSQPMQYVALRVDSDRGVLGFVRVAKPLRDIDERVAELNRLVWLATGATGLAATALAFWLAKHITRPLQELSQGARRIGAGEYGAKVYVLSNDEVGVLAQTFNQMSERLAEQFAQLDDDRQQLRTILSSMVEGVIALDAGQRILYANGRAAQLLRFQTDSAVGRKFWEIVRHRTVQDLVRKTLEGPEPGQGEVVWEGAGSNSLTVHAARLPGPPVRGVVLVMHDTTELRRLERVRQEFVANVSHELKTPLAVIKACVETLLDGAMDDVEHRGKFLEQIADQAERLHALVLDMLSLTRIESGEEFLELQAVDVADTVSRCLERHRTRAEGKNQMLRGIAPAPGSTDQRGAEAKPAPVTAWADEDALSQILDNLVDNALKYTPPGGRIQVSWRAENGEVLLEVEDTGIGIPQRDLPRVFERFYRVDRARSREMGGTGLGLSIVKHLAQAMKGSVAARSQLGQGTTFQVRLPRYP
jgi:two-component system phosphate regulon sensor histidine kinase PhoR